MRLIDIAIEEYIKEFDDEVLRAAMLNALRTGYKCGIRDQESGEINWEFIAKKYPKCIDEELK